MPPREKLSNQNQNEMGKISFLSPHFTFWWGTADIFLPHDLEGFYTRNANQPVRPRGKKEQNKTCFTNMTDPFFFRLG